MTKRKYYKPVPVFIPRNLNLIELIAEDKPGFNYHIDNFKYLVGLITEIPSFNKEALESDYTPLYSPLVQRKVHDYTNYLDYLVQHGVIESDGFWSEGKSIGYRFKKRYQTKVIIDFIKDRTALLKQFKADIKQDRKSVNNYEYLSKWFNSKLKIDYNKAMKYIEERFRKGRSKDKLKDLKKYNCGFVSIYRIHNKIFPFKVDDNVGRLHTILTNMSKDLRKFVTYNGQNLVACDIKNSQPFFSCRLFDLDFYEINNNDPEKFTFYNLTERITKETNKQQQTINKISNYIMLVKKAYESSSTFGGFKPFIEQTQNGTFYTDLKEECESNYNLTFYDRNHFKRKFLYYFFSDNKKHPKGKSEIKYTISQIIPDVDHVFDLFKEYDHTFLSRVLTTMESKLVLKIVAKRISKERPELPIWTIHDSVVCPVGNESYVANVMKEEAQNAIGIRPKVNFEYWTPDNLNGNTTANNIQFSKPDIA